MKNINIGMIGYKFMGKAHSNAFRQVNMFFDASASLTLKTICGRDEAWLAKAAHKFGWQGYETSWKKLIALDDIDLIDIASPSDTHKEVALAAIANGKNIFCEKPLALTTQDGREMLAAAQAKGIVHQIGFNYRFAPAVQLAKKLISEGKLGKINHFRGQFLQDWIVDPDFPFVWRLDKSVAGSGSLGDLGAHVVDMARFLVGEFDKVIGVSKTFVKERPLVEQMTGLSATKKSTGPTEMRKVTVDDATLFLAEFENGAVGLFEATRFATGNKNNFSFEINGSKGSVRFEFERMNELHYYSADDDAGVQGFRVIQASEGTHPYMQAWWPTGHVIGYEHTMVHEMYELTEAIANKKSVRPNFDDGVKCSQVLEAVDRSILEQSWIKVSSI